MSLVSEISGPAITDIPHTRWIFERIEGWAKRFPDRFAFAVDHQDQVEEYRYTDVLEQSADIASGLAARGIQRGDRVGIIMENVPQWVFVLLGSMRIGAVAVPLATTLSESSLKLLARHAGCRVIFADEHNWQKAENVSKEVGCQILKPSPGTAGPHRPLRGTDGVNGDDTAILIYTSGTTGNPKGVELTFNNLIHEIRGVLEYLELSPDHRILSVLPFSHVLPLIANGLGPLCCGAGVVFLSSISPQRIIEAFHQHRITFFICVPQFFYLLHKRIFAKVAVQPLPARLAFSVLRAISRRVQSEALRRRLCVKIHKTIGPDLRLLASGGSRLDLQVAKDLSSFGYTMLQAYGLTETSAAATITPVRANHVGSVGKPVRGVTIRIDSPNEEGVGEIWIRGPIVMKGYYLDKEKTAEVMSDDWFRTGDLGFIHPDGNLEITGRSKDVIVLANGKNVYPEELEMHYEQSPYIKEICILGVTEDHATPAGETLHGIVVPDMDEFRKRGQTAITETIRFEIENLSKQVPSYYRIHSLSVRNQPLPRTVTRKLKRFEIQAEETSRRKSLSEREKGEDDPKFRHGIGAVIAELVRESKPEAEALDPSTNLELDLGFDSLGRVELFGLAEARLGTHIEDATAARIFTLGELLDAVEAATSSKTGAGRTWQEILNAPETDELLSHYVFSSRPFLNPSTFVAMKFVKGLARMFFSLRYYGIEKLPSSPPFLLCPNHESFLDGPLLVSTLPRRFIYKMLILGYSDYWENAFSRRLAQICNIVAIDPNVNLIRAMQAGAAGLKRGRVLLIFPEGTRSIDGRVAEFKKGAAILAYELRVPIVPVGIRGTFESWPRGGKFRFHPVEFHFGDPIDPLSFRKSPDPYTAITEKLRNDVKALSADNDPSVTLFTNTPYQT